MTEQRNRTDNTYLKRQDRRDRRSTDAFGKKIADGTRNELDIPAIYDFNPERLRLAIDGTRTEPGDTAVFTDGDGYYELTPDANQTAEIFTAERPRYIVGYDSDMSMASRVVDSLGSGDTLRIGGRDKQDTENKAYFEINGGSDNQIVLEKDGTETASQTFAFPDGLDETSPIRYEIIFNAYSVGRWEFNISYTDNTQPDGDKQRNVRVGELVVDDEFSVHDYNLHLFQEIDAANAGIELRAGSFGYKVLGAIQETTRTKGARLSDLSYGGSGEYEALAAIRIDPDNANVYAQFKSIDVFPDGGSGQLVAVVFESDETDASAFNAPPEQNPTNTVVEQTTNVSEFTDQSGTTVTQTNNPNGYQVGFDVFESTGTGTNVRTAAGQQVENKRPLYEGDVALFLYKADTASSRSVNISYFVEQDW